MEHKNSRNYSGIELVPVYSYVRIGPSHETAKREKSTTPTQGLLGPFRENCALQQNSLQ
jgi:hypothetical protein